jgi:hypothetical protein
MLEGVGELASAQSPYERAWTVDEKVPVPSIPVRRRASTTSLVCFGLRSLAGAQPLCERALAIKEKVHGPEHPGMAWSFISLASASAYCAIDANSCCTVAFHRRAERGGRSPPLLKRPRHRWIIACSSGATALAIVAACEMMVSRGRPS